MSDVLKSCEHWAGHRPTWNDPLEVFRRNRGRWTETKPFKPKMPVKMEKLPSLKRLKVLARQEEQSEVRRSKSARAAKRQPCPEKQPQSECSP